MILTAQDLIDEEEGLKKQPDNPLFFKKAANHCLQAGRYKQAKNYYNRAANLAPRLVSEIILDYERAITADWQRIGIRLSLAGFCLAQDNFLAGILELEEALDVDPQNVEVYNVLGKIMVKQEKIDATISLLETSLKEGVRDVALTEILAGAYLEKGRIVEAVKFYQELLNYKPGDKHVLRVLGDLFTRLEKYPQAAESYQAMFSDDPEVAQEVIQRLESLLKKLEGNVYIREILANVYMSSLKPDLAVAKLIEILKLEPSKLEDIIVRLKGILKNYPEHPAASLALAGALRLLGNYSEAVETYYQLVRVRPEFIEDAIMGYHDVLDLCPEQLLARTYLAEAYLYKKQIKEALQEFEKMLKLDPESGEIVVRKCRDVIKHFPQLLLAQVVLGQAYLAKDETQKAITCAEEVLSIDKKFTGAYLLLGEAYFKLKMGRKAAEVLRQALSLDPFNMILHQKYRQVKQKELEDEIVRTKKRLSEDQWKISLHLDLAKLYLQNDQREESIRELQIVIKDQTRAPFACNILGCIYRREGRFDLAAAQFNRALELAPAEIADFSRTVKLNLGTSYEGFGLVRKALKIYEGIMQEDIDFGDLRRRVKRLKQTSLRSLRHKALVIAVSRADKGEVVALWGREGRSTKAGHKEEVSVSFGQKHADSGYDYFVKGMNKAALEEFQLAVQLDAGFAIALNNLAVTLIKEGKLTEARLKLEEASRLEPNSLIYCNNLGALYFLLGRIEQARKELEKAHKLDPELAAVCLNLGDVYYLRRRAKEAIGLYQQVGDFDPLSELAEQRLTYKKP